MTLPCPHPYIKLIKRKIITSDYTFIIYILGESISVYVHVYGCIYAFVGSTIYGANKYEEKKKKIQATVYLAHG